MPERIKDRVRRALDGFQTDAKMELEERGEELTIKSRNTGAVASAAEYLKGKGFHVEPRGRWAWSIKLELDDASRKEPTEWDNAT